MDAATPRGPTDGIAAFLAGLQAGMVGVCWMLLWLGLTSIRQLRSFWTAENLMASAFYGGSAIHEGFASETISGLALYVLLYTLLGALFAMIVRDHFSPVRTILFAMAFALGWYYLSFHVLWKSAIPLLALLHTEGPTLLGHVIYGIFLGRFPAYLRRETTVITLPHDDRTPQFPPEPS